MSKDRIPYIEENTIDVAAAVNDSLRVVDGVVTDRVEAIVDELPPTAKQSDKYAVNAGDKAGLIAKFVETDAGGFWEYFDSVLCELDGVVYVSDGKVWQEVKSNGGLPDNVLTQDDVQQELSESYKPVSAKAVKIAIDNIDIGDVDLSEYRKLDNIDFDSIIKINAKDNVGAGVFLLCPDNKVRGQMVYNNYGLQFAQVQEDGTAQTFTFPSYGNGGEIAMKADVDSKQDKLEFVGDANGKVMKEGAYGLGSISLDNKTSDFNNNRYPRGFYFADAFKPSNEAASVLIGGMCGNTGGMLHIGRSGNVHTISRELNNWGEWVLHLTDKNTYPDTNGYLNNKPNPIDTLTQSDMTDHVQAGLNQPVTSSGVYGALEELKQRIAALEAKLSEA